MKLYSITVTAHVDDLDELDVHIDADVQIPSPQLHGIVMSILPKHLRKVADDTEASANKPRPAITIKKRPS